MLFNLCFLKFTQGDIWSSCPFFLNVQCHCTFLWQFIYYQASIGGYLSCLQFFTVIELQEAFLYILHLASVWEFADSVDPEVELLDWGFILHWIYCGQLITQSGCTNLRSTGRSSEFLFEHIFANTWHCQSFKFLPIWKL